MKLAKECLRSCIRSSGIPASFRALFHEQKIDTYGCLVFGLGTTYGHPSQRGSCDKTCWTLSEMGTCLALPDLVIGIRHCLRPRSKSSHFASSSSRFRHPISNSSGTMYLSWVLSLSLSTPTRRLVSSAVR